MGFARNLEIKGYPVSSVKKRQSCNISRYVVTCLGKWGANFRATPGNLQKKIRFHLRICERLSARKLVPVKDYVIK